LVAAGAVEELDGVLHVGQAAQASVDGGDGRRQQHRRVEQPVGAAVDVPGVVEGDAIEGGGAVAIEIDALRAVGEDAGAADAIAGAAEDGHANAGVGSHVGGGGGSADRVVVARPLHQNAVAEVGQRRGGKDVETDDSGVDGGVRREIGRA